MNSASPHLDLRPDYWAIVRNVLHRHVPNRKVLAFGSRANWTAKEYSDLDLAIQGDKPLPLDSISALAEGFGESDLPFKVDLVDWTRIDETFRSIIRRDGVVVQMSANDRWKQDTRQQSPTICGNSDITDSWISLPIEEIGEVVGGSTPSTRDSRNFNGDVPWLTPRDLSNFSDRWISRGERNLSQRGLEACSAKLLPKGAVLLTSRAPVGYVALAASPIATNQGFRSIIVRANHDPEFLYYWLKANKELLERYATGTTFKELSSNALKRITVVLPESRADQHAIAHILGTLDDKIELNRRMNETQEAMARAIFKDWFVDFGPTRAKTEGRAPYLPSEVWDLFPDTLDGEGKPVGWAVAPLAALAEVNPESWSKQNAPEEVEYVDLANTKWGTIEATQRFRWQDAPSRARRILRPGDTLVGMVRPGNGSFAFIGIPGLTGSTGFAVLRPRQFRYTQLVFLSATAPENIERLAYLADGAAYPAVRSEVVGATEVAFCGDAVATSFSALVSPILDRMEFNKTENITLAQARDLLLPKLMSGEIRLAEAEEVVETVA